jgi:hypothetical protein
MRSVGGRIHVSRLLLAGSYFFTRNVCRQTIRQAGENLKKICPGLHDGALPVAPSLPGTSLLKIHPSAVNISGLGGQDHTDERLKLLFLLGKIVRDREIN